MHDYVNLPRLKSDKNQALTHSLTSITRQRHRSPVPSLPLCELDGWIIMAANVEIGSFPLPRPEAKTVVGRGRIFGSSPCRGKRFRLRYECRS